MRRVFPFAAPIVSMLALVPSTAVIVHAEAVELRVVERSGRSAVTGPSDAELNFSVQARVVNAAPTVALSDIGFTIHLVGEPESGGSLERGLICNPDRTYSPQVGVSNVVGRGGLAA